MALLPVTDTTDLVRLRFPPFVRRLSFNLFHKSKEKSSKATNLKMTKLDKTGITSAPTMFNDQSIKSLCGENKGELFIAFSLSLLAFTF